MNDWKLYRTRFLAKAQRLDQTCTVTDALGRQQQGGPGDYLVEGPDGSRRIAPAHVFEDIYVEFEAAGIPWNLRAGAHPRRHQGVK